jgi:16S rRNA (cytosine1402-N4)-methyltransferase
MKNVRPHIPVLLPEIVDALAPRDGGIYVDGTFGRGGYSRALLNAANTQVVAIDRDPDAIEAGRQMVAEFNPRLTLLQGPFGAMDVLLAGRHIFRVDGIALDLGVSSPQFDEAERGFSFSASTALLDMRMSQSGPTAQPMSSTHMDERELADVIYTLGEERHSRRVAKPHCRKSARTSASRARGNLPKSSAKPFRARTTGSILPRAVFKPCAST